MIGGDLIFTIVQGITRSGIYILFGIGLSLILGSSRILNLIHGAIMTLGAYGAFFLFQYWGLDPFASMVPIFVLVFLGGIIIYKYLLGGDRILKEMEKGSREHMMYALLILLSLGTVLRNTYVLIWTSDTRSFSTAVSLRGVDFLGGTLPIQNILNFVFAIAVTIFLYYFLTRTMKGKAINASIQDERAARIYGLNPSRLTQMVYGLGLGLAAVAGALVAVTYSFNPTAGLRYLPVGFSVAVLGGVGSMPGAALAGIIIGVAETVGSHYLGTGLQGVIASAIFLIVLAVKPSGLRG